jgi:hypothetical protein
LPGGAGKKRTVAARKIARGRRETDGMVAEKTIGDKLWGH